VILVKLKKVFVQHGNCDILPQNLQNPNVTFHIASGEIKSKVIEYILLKKPLGALKLPFDES
jgi:hypothetical protein